MSLRRASPAAGGKPFRGRRASRPHTHEDTVRSAAAWVVERTLASLAPSSVYLESALQQCEPRDHGLLRELALGTLRWLRRLDHVIACASHRPFDDIEPRLHAPLRVAAYQLLFLDRVPAHAVVNEAVEQARGVTHRGGVSFTNAVLRRIARQPRLRDWPVTSDDKITRLAIETSHPDFLVRRWLERFGRARTRALLEANNQPKALHLLTFRDRGGSAPLAEALIDRGLTVEPSDLAPLGLVVRRGNPLRSPAYRRGDFYLQDEASQAAALIPPPQPGERVLDAAAAPGGKSFALLAVEPSLEPFLADVSPSRIGTLRANLKRLGRRLPLVVADAGQPAFRGRFDRVVLDLPCTGTGTLRKHPELKWRISESEIGRLARQSLRLLEGVAPLVRPGGLLVAITCSLEREENEDVVARFRRRHPELVPLGLAGRLSYPHERWIVGPGLWQVLPAGDHDGFTVHVLEHRR